MMAYLLQRYDYIWVSTLLAYVRVEMVAPQNLLHAPDYFSVHMHFRSEVRAMILVCLVEVKIY